MEWLEVGYLGLFLATFLAATVIPFSSEVMLLATLAAGFEPFTCFVVATAGNSLGGFTSYGLGYLADWNKITSWFKLKEDRVMSWQNTIAKYGSYTAILCWLPFIGDVIAVALGVFRSSIISTFIWMTLGKGLRYYAIIWVMK